MKKNAIMRNENPAIPLHLVIDTCAFKNDRKRKSAAIETISRLAKAGLLVVHSPEFVERELLSQQTEILKDVQTHFDQSFRKIHSLPLSHYHEDVITDLDNRIKELINDVEQYAESQFISWLNSINAKRYEIANDHAARVANAYFEGSLPFRNIKYRPDIPDSFIWEAVLDIAKETGKLAFVAGDKKFLKSIPKQSDILPFESLSELLDSKEGKFLLDQYYDKDEEIAILDLVSRHSSTIESKLRDSFGNYFTMVRIYDPKIFPPGTTAYIMEYEECYSLKVFSSEAKYYGDNSVVIQFSAILKVLICFEIEECKYSSESKSMSVCACFGSPSSGFENVHSYFKIKVTGRVGVKIPVESIEYSEKKINLSEAQLEMATTEIESIDTINIMEGPFI